MSKFIVDVLAVATIIVVIGSVIGLVGLSIMSELGFRW